MESNGTVGDDGRTVTWRPKFGQRSDFRAIAEDGTGIPRMVVVGIAAAVILSAVAFVAVAKVRRGTREVS